MLGFEITAGRRRLIIVPHTPKNTSVRITITLTILRILMEMDRKQQIMLIHAHTIFRAGHGNKKISSKLGLS